MWSVILPTLIAIITLVVTVKLMGRQSDFRWYRFQGGNRYYVASDSVNDSKIGKIVTVYNRWGGKERVVLGQRRSFVGKRDQILYDFTVT